MREQIKNNFKHHEPTDEKIAKYEAVRGLAESLAHFIDDVCPDSREKSLSITNLEQAVMWANAGIARNRE